MSPLQAPDRDLVLLSVPADGVYLGVLRTAAAGLAARLHFSLDEVEDLRMAVDEACAMLIGLAAPAAELRCRFTVTGSVPELGVELAVQAAAGATLPTTSSFGWKVLTSLTRTTEADITDRLAVVRLIARRS